MGIRISDLFKVHDLTLTKQLDPSKGARPKAGAPSKEVCPTERTAHHNPRRTETDERRGVVGDKMCPNVAKNNTCLNDILQ